MSDINDIKVIDGNLWSGDMQITTSRDAPTVSAEVVELLTRIQWTQDEDRESPRFFCSDCQSTGQQEPFEDEAGYLAYRVLGTHAPDCVLARIAGLPRAEPVVS